tara:strand:- start:182 stop:2281 length:2100 start_codon:yes stop_codon:yes gene_type:complete
MNKDASLSVSKEIDSSTFLTTNIGTDGAVTVGFSKNGTGPNLKAPKGSECTISLDGTSSCSMPSNTDSDSGITSQVLSTLNTDGSTLIQMSFSGGSQRTANADSSTSSTSTLSTDSGLSVAIDTSSGVTASMAVSEGTLAASLANDGTASTSFDNGTKKTTFTSSISMNLEVKSGKVLSTSSAEVGSDGVSRTITGTTTSEETSIKVGDDTDISELKVDVGSTISLSKSRSITSSFARDSSVTNSVALNSEGLMIPSNTWTSSNEKEIFPSVGVGTTVTQDFEKLEIRIPLISSSTSRSISRKSTPSRTSLRSGVDSEYSFIGQWVGTDSSTGKPVYVQSASSDAVLVLENAYDNITNVRLASGTAKIRIGDGELSSFTGTKSVNNIPASVTMSGSRNLIAIPSYTSIVPASFENQFSNYKAIWVRRGNSWQFYTSSDNKTIYTDKGYTELNSTIEAGEGIWVELNSPINPTKFEIANYGGYSALPQLSKMNSEWNLAGTAKKISVEEITKAGNFDQTTEDETNTIGFLQNFGGGGGSPGNQISYSEFEVFNEFNHSSKIAFLFVMMLFASVSLIKYQRKFLYGNSKFFQGSNIKAPAWQLSVVFGIIFILVACAAPESDSTSSTKDFSGSYDRVHSVWKWDDDDSKWLAYSPKISVALELSNLGYTSFNYVEKGEGYWVRLSTSGVPTSLSFAEPPAF